MVSCLLDEDAVLQISFVGKDALALAVWFADLTGKSPPPKGKAAEPVEARSLYRGWPAA